MKVLVILAHINVWYVFLLVFVPYVLTRFLRLHAIVAIGYVFMDLWIHLGLMLIKDAYNLYELLLLKCAPCIFSLHFNILLICSS